MCDRCDELESQLIVDSIIIDELRANPRAEVEAAKAEARRWQQEYKSLQAESDYCSVEHVEELEAQLNAVKEAA